MSVRAHARAEREDLLALVEGLDAAQWERSSLCEGWRVRDVVAHAIGFDDLDLQGLLGRSVRGRMWVPTINAVGVEALRDVPTAELVALVRRHLDPRGLTAAFGCRIALTDGMVHQQDVRRPLGLPRAIPAERLRPALTFALWAPPLRGAVTARGVRLVAEDVDWSWGRGPEVRGPGEAVLMALAGRPAALADLAGPGVDVLARRLR